MKKAVKLLLIIGLVLSLSGCAKCINTSYEAVEVRITNEYYRRAFFTPIHTGNATNMIYHSAVYRIMVEYNGTEYAINGRGTYEKYSGRVGEIAIGCLRIREYDDGTTEYDIIGLSDEGR